MAKRQGDSKRRAGYTLAELMVVMAIIGVLSVTATPFFLTYYQASKLRAAAEQVAAFLNQGRQMGIRDNAGICVHITSTAVHFHMGNCSGTTWVGPGTDAAGNIRLPEGMTISTTADPVFSYLGAASPAATYTVRNTKTDQTLRVFVSASGRVNIGP